MDLNSSLGKPEAACRVCGDKASGKHYGVASCDGCRGFFKRSIRRNLDYVCKDNNRCVVDVTRRNQCQACRFSKCLRVNMKKDAVQHERAPRSGLPHQQIALQKLNYIGRQLNLTGQVFPPAPHGFDLTAAAATAAPLHASFLDARLPSFSRVPDFPPEGFHFASASNPLLAASLGSVNSFKFPLFPAAAALHYPMPAPGLSGMAGYFPSMFYPSMMPVEKSFPVTCASVMESRPVAQQRSPEQAGASGKLEEEEVTSSEEAFKTMGTMATAVHEDYRSKRPRPSPAGAESPIAHVIANEKYLPKPDYTSSKFSRPEDSLELSISKQPAFASPYISEDKLHEDTFFSILSESVQEPAAKLLFICVKWARSLPSFQQLSPRDQETLLCSSWKELFVLTGAQWSTLIGEEQLTCNETPELREESRRLSAVIRRISQYRMDHTEYTCLKATVLFRSENLDSSASSHVDLYQEQNLAMLQDHCVCASGKSSSRFGRLLLLLPAVSCLAAHGRLEQLVFTTKRDVTIDAILKQIMPYVTCK